MRRPRWLPLTEQDYYDSTRTPRVQTRQAYYFGQDSCEPQGGFKSTIRNNYVEDFYITMLDGALFPKQPEPRDQEHKLVGNPRLKLKKPRKRRRREPFRPWYPFLSPPIIVTVAQYFSMRKLYREGQLIPAHEIPYLRRNTWVP